MALILIPTLAALVLGGLRVVSSLDTAAGYQRVNDLARLVESVAGLTHELQAERDRAAWNAAIGRPAKAVSAVNAQIKLADTALADVRRLATDARSKVGERAGDEVEHILAKLDSLEPLRKQAVEGTLLPSAVLEQYSLVIENLLSLQDELAKNAQDDRLTAMSVTLAALARAKESASVQRGLLTTVLPARRFEQAQLQDFLGAMSAQERELREFRKSASREERSDYDSTVTGDQVDDAEFLRTLVLDRANAGFPLNGLDRAVRDDNRRWFDAMTQPINRVRTVEAKLNSSIVARSQQLKDDERQRALIVAGAVALLLIAVLAITTGVAQSLVRPLRRLRSEALEIAGHRLPGVVQRLREAGDTSETPHIAPIGVVARDEIGEVARAFDEVHREAVRLAGDEARLRSNVNAMFVNLSRRTQTLVERQLSLIDGLEQSEQDERRLGDMFKLDHLATRMRRNSENLLVLAGQEPARRWGQPVSIVDVVRASLSEVEGYERVDVRVQPGAAVVGQAVNDVVHLIAELVENSISFSPRETKVVVSSNRIDGGGLIVSVSDRGIGMTPDEVAQTNHRLANPPVVDVSVSRRMGLFVVGRLALRHGIRVQLRQQDVGGLTAMVLLPESLLAQPGPAFPGMAGASGDFGMPAQIGASSGMGMTGELNMPGERGIPEPTGSNPFDEPTGPNSFGHAPRPSLFGADAPGLNTPGVGTAGPGAPRGDSFERGPFETFPRESVGRDPDPFARAPFGGGPVRREPGGPDASESISSSTDPFETTKFDFDVSPAESGRFEANPFDTNPFARGRIGGEAPVDTPWPGHLPPPGSTSWPGSPPSQDQTTDTGGEWPGWPGGGAFEGDIDHTGPLPVVRTSPMESEEEFLPIFAAVESDWFKKVDLSDEKSDSDDEPPAKLWSSPADAGWQAAKAAAEPTLGGVTASGLPKRVPKANLVPGSATTPASAPVPAEPAAAAGPPPPPMLSPERVRSRLASFQQGVRQGRAVARGETGEDQAYPGAPRLGDPIAQDSEKED